jgi:hypothetical protein
VAGGGDDAVVTTTTDAVGTYQFTALPAGIVRIDVDVTSVPSGLAASFDPLVDTDAVIDGSALVELDPVLGAPLADFGFTGTATLEGIVVFDRDVDGALDVPGDIPLDLVQVRVIWEGFDGVFGSADDMTYGVATTDDLGRYRFTGLPAGRFSVDIDPSTVPTGIDTPSFDPFVDVDGSIDGVATVVVPGDSTVNADFGLTANGSIAGRVVLDVDGDAVLDAGDDPIAGIIVTVTWDGIDGTPGTVDDVQWTMVTGDDGYRFSNLPTGSYIVEVGETTLPDGVVASFDPDTILDHATSLTIAAGDHAADMDFGYAGVATIRGLVFLDDDLDGSHGGSEAGLAEISVTATWAGPDGTIGTDDDTKWVTMSSSDGSVRFDHLPAGEILLTVDAADIPTGLTPTTSGYQTTVIAVDGEVVDATPLGFGSNVPPVAVDDTVTTRANTSVTFNVFDDDTDADDGIDPSSLRIVDRPTHGTVVIDPTTGNVTYTPNPTYTGPDQLTYEICENPRGSTVGPLCDLAVVDITVLNTRPFVFGGGDTPILRAVNVGETLERVELGDPDGHRATITRIDGDLPNGLRINPDGTFVGTSTTPGSYEVTITVCDDGNPQLCVAQDLTITVTNKKLATTGAETHFLARLSAILLLAGLAITQVARRRRPAH